MRVDNDSINSVAGPSVLVVGLERNTADRTDGRVRWISDSLQAHGIAVSAVSLEFSARTRSRYGRAIFSGAISLLRSWRNVLSEVRRHECIHLDFNLSHSSVVSALIVLAASGFLGKRSVVVVSSVTPESMRGLRGLILQRMLRMATVVVAGSDSAERQLSRFSANVRMIPVIALARESGSRITDNLQPRVGLVAPYDSAVLRSVVRALALAKQKYPRAELAVLASGRQIDNVISYLGETTRNGVEVIACESESQMTQVLGTCDVYLETSPRVDPSPAFIEALALGRPIIATDTCGIVSSIEHGANGLVVAAGNHAELANRLCELVESPALVKTLSEGARALAGVNDESAVVAAWVYLYSSLSSSGTAMPRRRRFLPQYQTSVKA